MDVIKNFTKDPQAHLDYGFDWSDWLHEGEAIVTSTWTTALTASDPGVVTGVTVVWLSGGTAGRDYIVTNEIITDSVPSRTDDRSFTIHVEER